MRPSTEVRRAIAHLHTLKAELHGIYDLLLGHSDDIIHKVADDGPCQIAHPAPQAVRQGSGPLTLHRLPSLL